MDDFLGKILINVGFHSTPVKCVDLVLTVKRL